MENIIKKFNIQELNLEQKKKVDKIIKLIVELKNENVNTCVASTPQNKLIFYKANAWLDSMEQIQDLHNYHKVDYVYEGNNQPQSIIDAVGY